MATIQLQLQAANIARLPAAEHYAAAAAPLLLGDEEANNIPNDGARQADSINAAGGSRFSWLPTFLAFLLLTLNSVTAIVRSQGDMTSFVCFSYAILVALFVCLKMYERARAGSAKRKWLKIVVWVLTTLLTFTFSSKVAAVMPVPVAVLVWMMAFATVAGGFFAFFVYQEKNGGSISFEKQEKQGRETEERNAGLVQIQTKFLHADSES
ncbi:unnamed protein product [Urochloa decumbens]|uniref:Uncharacterized protein n=1 Tax=Urochloa decumbens TaxID=240449 RepID=A0ABC9CN46_9POAL